MKPVRQYGLWRSRPVAWAVRLFAGIVGALGLTAFAHELFRLGVDDPPRKPIEDE